MDHITEARMKNLEDEMRRFEEETRDVVETACQPMRPLPAPPMPVFVPPQLKNRPMLPPPRPPIQVSHNFAPGFVGPISPFQPNPIVRALSPFVPPQVQISAPPVISAQKVVYAAPPVKITPARAAFVEPPKPVIKPVSLPSVKVVPKPVPVAPAPSSSQTLARPNEAQDKKKTDSSKKKKFLRTAAGVVWEDPTLADWDPDDFRMFCGNLGTEVTDETLNKVFKMYPSFQRAKVVRDKKTAKSKGFGFASFKDANDFLKAVRDLNGKFVGSRPILLKRSSWKDRQVESVRKKEKEKKKLGLR